MAQAGDFPSPASNIDNACKPTCRCMRGGAWHGPYRYRKARRQGTVYSECEGRSPILKVSGKPKSENASYRFAQRLAQRYPFLNAAIEDIVLAYNLVIHQGYQFPEDDFGPTIIAGQTYGLQFGSPRHVVCLLHDALEFILYEALRALGADIYKSGQNTIGLDKALDLCRDDNIDVPLIEMVREIQKHRGDAKHHAQVPHPRAFHRMVSDFPIIASRLIHERFGKSVEGITDLGIRPYHIALFDCFRKCRTPHMWEEALRVALGALIHKHRFVLGQPDDYVAGRIRDYRHLLGMLRGELAKATYPPVIPEALETLKALPERLEALLDQKQIAEAAETAGWGFAAIDGVLPGVFDIKTAWRITDRLYQPWRLTVQEPTFLRSLLTYDETPRSIGIPQERLPELLKCQPELVRSFGPPDNVDGTGFWEFVVFDGTRWQTFHLSHQFRLSPEHRYDEEEEKDNEWLTELIITEFERATTERLGHEA